MGSVDFTTINQHQLVEAVFCTCGGELIDDLLPRDYKGKKADIVFSGGNVIAEIKSLTSDRAADEGVSAKLGSILEEGVAFGAPIISARRRSTSTIFPGRLPNGQCAFSVGGRAKR
jgi:hypothetical protein